DEVAVLPGEVLVEDAVAPAGGAVADVEDEVVAVVGDVGGDAPARVVGHLVDESVFALRGAELVVVELLVERQALELLAGLRLGEAAVEEALVVWRPRGAPELTPLVFVSEDLPPGTARGLPGGP